MTTMPAAVSRGARSDRRTTQPPGVPMTGRLLEEWCVNASSDPRDWFTQEERRRAAANFAAERARRGRRGVRIPHGIIIITGGVGVGKSAVANYFCSIFNLNGAEAYHNGPFGYGRALTDEREWFSAISNIEPGSVLFMDEGASFNRAGRDNSDIQGLQIEGFTTVRKQEALVFYATAASRRLGPTLRAMADQIWRPIKLMVRYSDEQHRRYRRRGYPKGKDNPGNFAYGLYSVQDNPYREPDIFDEVLGIGGHNIKKGKRPDIHFKTLDARWMRLVAPLLDTFRPVPVGAAMKVNRKEVLNIARGDADGGGSPDDRFWRTVGQFVRAFTTGRLDIPPYPPPGQVYAPQYCTVSDLLRRIGSELTTAQLSRTLREDLRLAPAGSRGYELLEVFEAVQAAYEQWQQQPETEHLALPGLADGD